MIYETIDLGSRFPGLPRAYPATLTVYARAASPELGARRYPACVICPGGAYAGLSEREGEPVALALAARGIQCFVLRYSVVPARYPTQLLQAAAAFAYLRENAALYQLAPDALHILGFSAGGHLAGHYASAWSMPLLRETLGVEREALRPNGAILCYGVLSALERTHGDSIRNLLGEQDTPAMREAISFEKNVSADTPPAFLWHTAADDAVPVENSLYAAEALSRAHIPFEMHIYPEGGHGLALGDWRTDWLGKSPRPVARWTEDCAAWILRQAGLGD